MERERRKYEMGLAMISLGHTDRKQKQQVATNFASLQWRDEVVTVAKRRKIEEEREEELKKKKEDALRKAKKMSIEMMKLRRSHRDHDRKYHR